MMRKHVALETLRIDDERDGDDELHPERTGSRTSFMAEKFESQALACCGQRVSHVNKGNANDRSVQNVFSRSALRVPQRFACVPLDLLLLPFLFSLTPSFFRRPTSPVNYYLGVAQIE